MFGEWLSSCGAANGICNAARRGRCSAARSGLHLRTQRFRHAGREEPQAEAFEKGLAVAWTCILQRGVDFIDQRLLLVRRRAGHGSEIDLSGRMP
jgi:hypothetical protein